MDVLCGMHIIQYSARSTRLSVHKLFNSCIWRGIVLGYCNYFVSLQIQWHAVGDGRHCPQWSQLAKWTKNHKTYTLSVILVHIMWKYNVIHNLTGSTISTYHIALPSKHNQAIFGHMVSEVCERTDRHKDRRTNILIATFRTPPPGAQ